MMNIKTSKFYKIRLVYFYIELLFLFLYILCEDIIVLKFNLVILLIHLLTLCLYFKNQLKFIFLSFLSLYIVNLLPYFFEGRQMSMYKTYNTFEFYTHTLFLFQIFLSFFFCFIKKETQKKRCDLKIKNNLIFYFSSLFFLFCILFGKSGQTILDGNYGSINSNISPLYEYGLTFLALALLSKNSKKQKYLCYIIFMLYCFKSFLFGGRIEIIMATLLVFSIEFYEKFSRLKVIFAIVLGIFLVNIIGNIRSGQELINKIEFDKGYPIVNNYTEVFYSSTVYIQVRENEIKDINIPIKSITQTLMSVFDPGIGIINDNYFPANFSRSYANYGGGGHMFSYFFFWLGNIGVILSSFIVAYIFNHLDLNSKNKYINFWTIMCFATFPRWLVYSPLLLIKLNIYATFLYFILCTYHSSFKNRLHN